MLPSLPSQLLERLLPPRKTPSKLQRQPRDNLPAQLQQQPHPRRQKQVQERQPPLQLQLQLPSPAPPKRNHPESSTPHRTISQQTQSCATMLEGFRHPKSIHLLAEEEFYFHRLVCETMAPSELSLILQSTLSISSKAFESKCRYNVFFNCPTAWLGPLPS